MIRHFIVSLVAILLCISCATDPGPAPIFHQGTRVGIVNSLEPYLTHRHISIGRINSFTKQIKVDWKLPAYLNKKLSRSLKTDERFVLVPIKSPQIISRQKQLSDQINSAATRRRISQNLIDFIENTARAHELDVIIMVLSFKGESPWKIGKEPILLEGYGLFTRRTLLGAASVRSHWVHPYAQILVAVFQTQPVVRIGAGRPKMTRGNMDNFNWPADRKNVPRAELNKLRPRIEAYADQAMKNALQSANLIQGRDQ